MTGPFGTTAGKWWPETTSDGHLIVVFHDNHHGRDFPVTSFGMKEASANNKAMAQVPAMLELIDAMRAGPFAPVNWVEMARTIARELEEK